ncbi:MAG: hypothetical protein J6S04_00875 [Clostridia bacterium]|nr:hypothetical protein [Clostridia bacterium]
MKNYQIQPDEVIRFQSTVALQTEKGNIPAELILTNLNFIFVTERKNFLWFKRKPRSLAFAKESVKMFNDAPQIKQTGTAVLISFAEEDRIIVFDDKKDARIFVINAWQIVTGKNLFERGLDKLKEALDLIDEKFDINIIQLIKDSLTDGIKGAAINLIVGKAKNLLPKKK